MDGRHRYRRNLHGLGRVRTGDRRAAHHKSALGTEGVSATDIASLVHGTTVGTNAVLESAGVRAGLLITRGFRAVYEARGWVRPDTAELLDPFFRKPPLLVPQSRTQEIVERMDYQGNVLEPLDEQSVRQAARKLKAQGVEAVAVCYLFSFRNPTHEERTAEILAQEEPDWRISISSRVLPVIREYPRLSTTVIDAYVGPIMERYLTNLERRLKQLADACRGRDNVMPVLVDAVKDYVSLGEVSDVYRQAFGLYREPIIF